MLTFYEYIALCEGLWMPDNNALAGLSRITPPTPPKKTKSKPPTRLKSFHTMKASESLDQLHRNVADLEKLGVGLFPPKREDLGRLLDRYKNQIVIPQRSRRLRPRP